MMKQVKLSFAGLVGTLSALCLGTALLLALPGASEAQSNGQGKGCDKSCGGTKPCLKVAGCSCPNAVCF
jgi:hypothetical protein